MAGGDSGPGPLVFGVQPGARAARVPASGTGRGGVARQGPAGRVHRHVRRRRATPTTTRSSSTRASTSSTSRRPCRELEDLTIQAARAGKHMVLGKPMAMTRGAGRSDGRSGRDGRRHVLSVSGDHASARCRVESADRHRARSATSFCCTRPAAGRSPRTGTTRARPAGSSIRTHVPGGAFIDEGIYWIDLFRWLAGARSCRSRRRSRTWSTRTSPSKTGAWRRSRSPTASSRRWRPRGRSTRRGRPGPSPKQNSVVRLEVVGTRGEIIDQWFRAPGRAVLAAGADDWVFERQSEPPFGPPSPFPLNHLIECLDNNQTPAATIQDARRSLLWRWRRTNQRARGGQCALDPSA